MEDLDKLLGEIEGDDSPVEADSPADLLPEPEPEPEPETPAYDIERAREDFKWVWQRERNALSRPAIVRLSRVRDFINQMYQDSLL